LIGNTAIFSKESITDNTTFSVYHLKNKPHMELKNFIAQTFQDIAEGIIIAQDNLKETDAIINAFDTQNLRNITFDIAATMSKSNEKGITGGGKIYVASLETGSKKRSAESVVNRIQFTVPVVLPNAKKVDKKLEIQK